MEQPIIVKSQSTSGGVKFSKGLSIFRFFLKNWYFVLIFVSLIPGIIHSIQISKETNNPSYPFVQTGLSVVNADVVIYEDTKTLEEDPSKLIGMEKPDRGLVQKLKYLWKEFLVIWKFLGNLFLISLPFSIIYRIVKGEDESRRYHNTMKTLWIGLVFIFIMNLLYVIYRLIDGSLAMGFNAGWDIYQKIWYVIYLNLPLHGVFALGKYLIATI